MPEPARRTCVPSELLADVRDTLERTDCAFWACEGPTLKPIDMVTCHRCATLAQLRALMGDPATLPEETREAVEARRLERERRSFTGGGPSPDGCTTLVWR